MTKKILKSASTTNVNKLGAAIISQINEGNFVQLQAVGAAAVNQAVKSVIAANRIYGGEIIMRPSFGNSNTKEGHYCINFELEVIE